MPNHGQTNQLTFQTYSETKLYCQGLICLSSCKQRNIGIALIRVCLVQMEHLAIIVNKNHSLQTCFTPQFHMLTGRKSKSCFKYADIIINYDPRNKPQVSIMSAQYHGWRTSVIFVTFPFLASLFSTILQNGYA